jgi:hypothetical protein
MAAGQKPVLVEEAKSSEQSFMRYEVPTEPATFQS